MKFPEIRDSKNANFKEIEQKLEQMKERANEFCQTRSNFQIEKFIACDEYTPISKFRHVAHNSRVAMQEIRRMLIERERKLRKIENLKKAIEFQIPIEELNYLNEVPEDILNQEKPNKINPHFKDYDLDIYEIERQLEDMEIRIKGLLKEVSYMEQICDKLEKEEIEKTGSGFNAKKFQEREKVYWEKRLNSQMHCSQIGNMRGIGEGNYKSYLMALDTPILEDSNNQIEALSMDVNDLASKTLLDNPKARDFHLTKLEPGKQD